MDTILAFLAAVILISLIITKLGPFLSLVISAIVFGLLTGMGAELPGYISAGLSKIFSTLAIVVFCGALLAEYLRRTESLNRIVLDLGALTREGRLLCGAAGYLISLPVMCSITAFMMLEPIAKGLAQRGGMDPKGALFMTAACSIISFNLIYPSPVMITLSSELSADPQALLMRSIPISLILFGLTYLLMKLLFPEKEIGGEEAAHPEIGRGRAWAPLLLPFALMLLGGLQEKLSILSDPQYALLLAAMICLALERERILEMVHSASRRSGVILLDLCGAGAFGYVIAKSGLAVEIYDLSGFMPILLLPLVLSAILQFAQGSRVVTAAVSCQILADYPLPFETLALLIASGAFIFSYVTDPYFWLIKSSTGADMKQMVRGYTLPLSLLGLAAFALAAIFSIFD